MIIWMKVLNYATIALMVMNQSLKCKCTAPYKKHLVIDLVK